MGSTDNLGYGERKCKVCKKVFFLLPEWAYRQRNTVFCSWGCLRKYEAQMGTVKKGGKKKNPPLTMEQKSLASDMLREGQSVRMVANKLGVGNYPIQAVRNEMKEDGQI